MAASAPTERNDDNPAPNPRSRRKSDRRLQLLAAAERLFARSVPTVRIRRTPASLARASMGSRSASKAGS